jgi:hypothetical protein
MFALVLLDIVVDVGRVESQRVEERGSTHVTRSVVRRDDGTTAVVDHLGGTLDGVGVRVVGLPVLEPGERVALWREGPTLLARTRLSDSARREYVRATATESRAPLRWAETECLSVVPNTASSVDVGPEQALAAVQRAAANWNDATAECSYVGLTVEEPQDGAVPGYDRDGPNTNVVYWRTEFWGADPGTPYPPSAAGITTLRFFDEPGSDTAGELLDADIEINAVSFEFSTGGCDASAGELDLENTITHEMGHFLGLDHTCHDGLANPPRDDQGNPIPDCSSTLPPEVRQATMFSVARACEDFMRTPEPDDVAGICGIYPLAMGPGVCDPIGKGMGGADGCSCAIGGRPPSPAGGAALAFVGLLMARACSRCRRRSGCGAASCDPPRSSCAA